MKHRENLRSKLMDGQWAWVLALTGIAILLRFWHLGHPAEYVFDEIYYAKMAHDYLVGVPVLDVHPPLGKLIIASGIWLFGNTPIGWRFAGALFGSFVPLLTYAITRRLAFSERAALLGAFFVTIDGLLVVQSRTALLDSPLIVFDLMAYYACLRVMDGGSSRVRATRWLVAAGLFIGLATACKWTGLAPLPVIALFLWLWRAQRPKISWYVLVLSLVVLPASIYLMSFLANHGVAGFWSYVVDWHSYAWQFQQAEHSSHLYASRWWSWLYLGRPVWYYFQEQAGTVVGIDAIGNPILWWASIPALIASIWITLKNCIGFSHPAAVTSGVRSAGWRTKPPRFFRLPAGRQGGSAKVLVFPLAAFLVAYLPWAFIRRTEFQYYLVGGVPFLFMLLAWWIDRAASYRAGRVAMTTFLVLAVGCFAYFLPLMIGLPVSNAFFREHLWFPSWI